MLYILLTIVSVVQSTDNCFWDKEMKFVHERSDFSGNYTWVREYEVNKNITCDFLVESDTKVTCQSKYMSATYQVFYSNFKNKNLCVADNVDDYTTYIQDTQLEFGKDPNDSSR